MSDELRKKILEKIKTGQARMKPRWHFILKAMLLAAGLIIGFLTLLYLVSFILFVLRQTGAWFLPSFGFRGLMTFLMSLPRLLIISGIIFIVLLEILVRRYSFAYRKPLLYSLIGVIVFVTLAGIVVFKTSLHENLFLRARVGNLPLAGPLYRGFIMPQSRNVHIGTVIEIIDEGFQMETPRAEILKIIISPKTSFPAGIDFQKDDRVIVLGKRFDNTVNAEGIRRIDDMMSGGMMRQRLPRPGGWFVPVK